MCLFRSLGSWLTLVFLSSIFTGTSFAEALPNGMAEAGQESLNTLSSYLQFALVALLAAGIVFIKFRAHRRVGWQDSFDDEDFKRLVEESVNAGRSTMEKPTG